MGVMGARRPVSVLSVLLCALVASSFWGGAAWGAVTHAYLSQITEVPASSGVAAPGPLSEVSLMAVDAGNLFVAESGHEDEHGAFIPERLDEFDASSGAVERQFSLPSSSQTYFYYFGLAAGHATGQEQVYLGAEDSEFKDVVDVFDGEGHLLGSPWSGTPSGPFSPFGGIGGIAADGRSSGLGWSAGDVYVSDSSQKVVDVFRPTVGNVKGEYVTRIEGPEAGVPFGSPTLVAVNQSNGDVVVVDTSNDVVDVFEPTALETYALVRQITGTPAGPFSFVPTALAVDTNGDIYVGDGKRGGFVYEFNEKGEEIGQLTGTPAGAFRFVKSLAVDPETHDVYVGDEDGTSNETEETGAVDAFGPDLIVPSVTTGSASGVKPTSAIVSGTVNPDGAGEAMCQFASGTSAELGITAPCASPIPNGEAPVPVEQTLTGLSPDTTYVYRLQASNQNGLNPGEPYQDVEFHTPGPGIHQEWVTNVASGSVTLEARIDANGAPTTYYFQYGTSSGYGADAPPAPGASIGSTSGDLTVAQHVQGLVPGTAYHYRVVTRSELPGGEMVEFAGPDQTFTTEPAASGFVLPDGREWEMVSPPNKNGAALETPMSELGLAMQASIDGNAVTYTASAPTEDQPQGNRSNEPTQLLSRRGASGWGTKVITTPYSEVGSVSVGFGSEYQLFSADLSTAALYPFANAAIPSEATERTAYLRHDFTCEASPSTCYVPLVTPSNVESAGLKFGARRIFPMVGTPDLSHVIIESEMPLLPGSVGEAGNTYEWFDGKLKPVAILPDGSPSPDGGFVGGRQGRIRRHALSNDGSRVVFETLDESSKWHLYTRDTVTEKTVQVDAAEPGARGGSGEVGFQLASSDGSRIFFTDDARLTTDSTAVQSQPDLYEFNVNTGKTTDLTVDPNTGEHADVQGLVQGASEDGAYLYFAATGALAPGASPGHECAAGFPPPASSTCDLYVRHDGVTTFIATLSGLDQSFGNEVNGALEYVTARVSPDGRLFAFMSDRSLTGYDNRDASSGEPDEEVFLYDADTNHLSCVSCNPSGGRPEGMFEAENTAPLVDHQKLWSKRWLAGSLPGSGKVNLGAVVYQSRYLSDSGRLFFTSNDALVPQDINGRMDVYEFEPEGVGGCVGSNATFNAVTGGCVDLISSGSSGEESAFMDASESGNDVFFLTAAKLRPEDYDSGLDMYDARVCSDASPCLPVPPAGPPPCSTSDSCKPAPALQPTIFGAAPSATFSGIGDVTEVATGGVKQRSLTRQQRLARALRECRHKQGKRRRGVCEKRARERYGAKSSAKRSAVVRGAHGSSSSSGRR
jgi:hypothetical protein